MEIDTILKTLKRRKAFTALIVLQIALTFTVLGLSVLRTIITLEQWDLPSGLDEQQIVAVYQEVFDSTIDRRALVQQDLIKMDGLSQVLGAGAAEVFPFGNEQVTNVYLESAESARSFQSNIYNFDENAFDILGLKLLAGRKINFQDVVYVTEDTAPKSSVVMLSEEMAHTMFGSGNALGKNIYLEKGGSPVEVVGVFSNFMNGETLNARGMSYRNIIRPMVTLNSQRDLSYLLRVKAGTTEAFFETLREQLNINGRYLGQIEFTSRIKKRMYDGRTSRALISLGIGLLLLLITSIGIASLISFLVERQTQQIGIKRALGAKKSRITRYYLIEAGISAIMGLAIGMILIVVFLYLLSDSSDVGNGLPWVLVVMLFVWLVSVLSAWRPAALAAKVPPALITRV